MPCCSSARPVESWARHRRFLLGLAVAWGLAAVAGPAAAEVESLGAGVEPQLSLLRRSEGLFLSARLPIELSPTVEDVLRKGVPLHFLWTAELIQSRWYWLDKTVARVARTVRLAYQPLTRRWRLSYANGTPGASGLHYGLHQNFDSLADALVSAGHVSNWKLVDAARWGSAGEQRVEFSFVLDLTQLPRPFQLGLINQSSWNITLQKTLDVPDQISNDTEPSPPDARPEGES